MSNTKTKVNKDKSVDKKPRKIVKVEEKTPELVKRHRTKTTVESAVAAVHPATSVIVEKPSLRELDEMIELKEPIQVRDTLDIVDLTRYANEVSVPSQEDFAMIIESFTESALGQPNVVNYSNLISSPMLGRHIIEMTIGCTTPQSFGSWIKQFDRYYLFYHWTQNGMTLPWWFKYTKSSRTAKFKFSMNYRDVNEISKLATSLLPGNFYVKSVEAKLDRVAEIDNYVPHKGRYGNKLTWREKLQIRKKAFFKRLGQKFLAKSC